MSMHISCSKCDEYVKKIKDDFNRKLNLINTDNQILKVQIEKFLKSGSDFCEPNASVPFLKHQIEMLLKAKDLIEKENKKLQLEKSKVQDICASCNQSIKKLINDVTETEFYKKDGNNSIIKSSKNNIESICKKFLNLEICLKRQQQWSQDINVKYMKTLAEVHQLNEEKSVLENKVKRLSSKLKALKTNENDDMFVNGRKVTNSKRGNEESNVLNSKKFDFVSKIEKSTFLKKNRKTIKEIQKLLLKIPSIPDEKFLNSSSSDSDMEDKISDSKMNLIQGKQSGKSNSFECNSINAKKKIVTSDHSYSDFSVTDDEEEENINEIKVNKKNSPLKEVIEKEKNNSKNIGKTKRGRKPLKNKRDLKSSKENQVDRNLSDSDFSDLSNTGDFSNKNTLINQFSDTNKNGNNNENSEFEVNLSNFKENNLNCYKIQLEETKNSSNRQEDSENFSKKVDVEMNSEKTLRNDTFNQSIVDYTLNTHNKSKQTEVDIDLVDIENENVIKTVDLVNLPDNKSNKSVNNRNDLIEIQNEIDLNKDTIRSIENIQKNISVDLDSSFINESNEIDTVDNTLMNTHNNLKQTEVDNDGFDKGNDNENIKTIDEIKLTDNKSNNSPNNRNDLIEKQNEIDLNNDTIQSKANFSNISNSLESSLSNLNKVKRNEVAIDIFEFENECVVEKVKTVSVNDTSLEKLNNDTVIDIIEDKINDRNIVDMDISLVSSISSFSNETNLTNNNLYKCKRKEIEIDSDMETNCNETISNTKSIISVSAKKSRNLEINNDVNILKRDLNIKSINNEKTRKEKQDKKTVKRIKRTNTMIITKNSKKIKSSEFCSSSSDDNLSSFEDNRIEDDVISKSQCLDTEFTIDPDNLDFSGVFNFSNALYSRIDQSILAEIDEFEESGEHFINTSETMKDKSDLLLPKNEEANKFDRTILSEESGEQLNNSSEIMKDKSDISLRKNKEVNKADDDNEDDNNIEFNFSGNIVISSIPDLDDIDSFDDLLPANEISKSSGLSISTKEIVENLSFNINSTISSNSYVKNETISIPETSSVSINTSNEEQTGNSNKQLVTEGSIETVGDSDTTVEKNDLITNKRRKNPSESDEIDDSDDNFFMPTDIKFENINLIKIPDFLQSSTFYDLSIEDTGDIDNENSTELDNDDNFPVFNSNNFAHFTPIANIDLLDSIDDGNSETGSSKSRKRKQSESNDMNNEENNSNTDFIPKKVRISSNNSENCVDNQLDKSETSIPLNEYNFQMLKSLNIKKNLSKIKLKSVNEINMKILIGELFSKDLTVDIAFKKFEITDGSEYVFDTFTKCFFAVLFEMIYSSSPLVSDLSKFLQQTTVILSKCISLCCEQNRALTIFHTRLVEYILKLKLTDNNLAYIRIVLCIVFKLHMFLKLSYLSMTIIIDLLDKSKIPALTIISAIDSQFIDYSNTTLQNCQITILITFLKFLLDYENIELECQNRNHISPNGQQFWIIEKQEDPKFSMVYYLRDQLEKYPDSFQLISLLFSVVKNRCLK